jgi:hypothetical protein
MNPFETLHDPDQAIRTVNALRNRRLIEGLVNFDDIASIQLPPKPKKTKSVWSEYLDVPKNAAKQFGQDLYANIYAAAHTRNKKGGQGTYVIRSLVRGRLYEIRRVA